MEITACYIQQTIRNLKKSGVPYRESEMHWYIRRWGNLLMLELYERPMQWPIMGVEIGQDHPGMTLGNILIFGEN